PKRYRGEDPPLADLVWEQLQQHFVYRLALELDDVPVMHSYLLGQLLVLQKRILEHDGVMRVCGLSPLNRNVLEMHGLDHQLPNYCDRNEAVMGPRCIKPR
ncbi:MAG: STAS domain-containing protein, partial [Thermoguttaceae bacterium]